MLITIGFAVSSSLIAAGDKDVALPPDHDDDGLAGDVQITDAQAVPGALRPEHHLLQIDVLVISERFGAENQGVLRTQLHIAPRHHDFSLPLDGRHNDAGGQAQFDNGSAGPGVLSAKGDLDKMDI